MANDITSQLLLSLPVKASVPGSVFSSRAFIMKRPARTGGSFPSSSFRPRAVSQAPSSTFVFNGGSSPGAAGRASSPPAIFSGSSAAAAVQERAPEQSQDSSRSDFVTPPPILRSPQGKLPSVLDEGSESSLSGAFSALTRSAPAPPPTVAEESSSEEPRSRQDSWWDDDDGGGGIAPQGGSPTLPARACPPPLPHRSAEKSAFRRCRTMSDADQSALEVRRNNQVRQPLRDNVLLLPLFLTRPPPSLVSLILLRTIIALRPTGLLPPSSLSPAPFRGRWPRHRCSAAWRQPPREGRPV